MVRTNPLNTNSESEIDDCIKRGADRLMLPMFSSPSDVESFMRFVDGRVPVTLLLETPAAYARIDDILNLPFDFSVHVGLNDLHLGMNLSFMFELISCGFVQNIASKCRAQSISFGFGGVAPLSSPNLISPADILSCHVAYGSESVILSRDWRSLLSSQSFAAELSALHNYVEHPLPYCHQAFSDKVKRIAGCY